ncbi:MAG TPA: haloacid dehalogenase-like hydrolase [Gemmatimonadaceae bacterium]|nr:haloacid dehalogenase-like hydrolase [Gemmatimonadaceae bacterium]
MKVVLFDIDGTILRTEGAGRRAMERALLRVFGTKGEPRYRYDGKTDQQIVRELMRDAGFDDATIDSRMAEVISTYVAELHEELRLGADRVRCYAGVVALIDALETRSDRVIGLLTGNVEPGAFAKLKAAGIAGQRFRINAFGSDHESRSELPAIALQRARATLAAEMSGTALVLIGDTPSDIACGRGVGARAIAVATGNYSVTDLQAHDPHAAFGDLCDTAAVLQAIDDA